MYSQAHGDGLKQRLSTSAYAKQKRFKGYLAYLQTPSKTYETNTSMSKRFVLPSMVANMLALDVSPQAEKGKPQGNIKPFSLVASPMGQEKALSGRKIFNR